MFKYQPEWQGPLSGRSFERQTEDFLNGIESRVDEIDTRQTPSDATPMPPGIGSAGIAEEYSRGDHSHPLQTSVSGSAGSADVLSTARKISMSGEGSGLTYFDGSSDVDIPLEVSCTADGSTEFRAITARFADIINVKDYGAAGDGMASDTDAVQAALDAAHAQGGGTVFFPSGRYRVGALTVYSCTTLMGAGKTDTVMLQSAGITVYGGTGPGGQDEGKFLNPTRITGFRFAPAVADVPFCIQTDSNFTLYGHYDTVQIDNCIFSDESARNILGYPAQLGWVTVLKIGSSVGCTISDCLARGDYSVTENNNSHVFFSAEGPSGALSITRTHIFSFCQAIVFLDDTEGFVISNCEVVYVRDGIYCSRSVQKPGGWVSQVHVNCWRYGLYAENVNVLSVDGLYVFRGGTYYSVQGTSYCGVYLKNCQKFTLNCVNIRPSFDSYLGDTTYGISLDGCENFCVSDIASAYCQYHIFLQGCQFGSINGLSTYKGTYEGSANSLCSDVYVRNITNNQTTNKFVFSGSTPIVVGSPIYEKVDTSVVSIESTTAESLTIEKNSLLRRDVSAALEYTLTDDSRRGVVADFCATIRSGGSFTIKDSGGTSLFSSSTTQEVFVRMFFTGGLWRKVFATVSI